MNGRVRYCGYTLLYVVDESYVEAILVNGACSRVAAIEYVTKHRKASQMMKGKFDKTPERDRDRKMAFARWGVAAPRALQAELRRFDPWIDEKGT